MVKSNHTFLYLLKNGCGISVPTKHHNYWFEFADDKLHVTGWRVDDYFEFSKIGLGVALHKIKVIGAMSS